MPPVSGGRPSRRVPGGPASAATVSRSTSTGSPSVGTPGRRRAEPGGPPSRSVSVAALRTPMNEYRDQAVPAEPAPCSADSSRNVPGPPAACGRRRPGSPRRRAAAGPPARPGGRGPASAKVARSGLTAPVVMACLPAGPTGSSSVTKQVRCRCGRPAPTWSTLTSSVSPSQSSATDVTYWWCPEVSPLTQYSPRLRDQ